MGAEASCCTGGGFHGLGLAGCLLIPNRGSSQNGGAGPSWESMGKLVSSKQGKDLWKAREQEAGLGSSWVGEMKGEWSTEGTQRDDKPECKGG